MTYHNIDFPFDEVRDDIAGGNGDMFDSIAQCKAAGFDTDQIWCITEEDDVFTHGPSHHYVNRLGYVCTNERHDGATYYSCDTREDIEESV
jgi:hypothetical protein